MISGLKNRVYMASGLRSYGSCPSLARARGYWEFQFILKGKARAFGTELGAADLRKPRAYILHPDSVHGWTDDPAGISEIAVVHFMEIPDELAVRVGPKTPLVVELDQEDAGRIARMFKEAHRSARMEGALNSLMIQSLMIELAVLIMRRTGGVPVIDVSADRVGRATHWMEENVGASPTVTRAARATGVSVAHLRRLFAEAGRPAPRAVLLHLRMMTAQRCLREGWSQKRVADYLGFSDISAFSRAFRDFHGITPGRWFRAHVMRS